MNSDSNIFVKNLLETVTLQCKNNLKFKNDIKIQGMLAVTMDSSGILLIPFDETWSKNTYPNVQGCNKNSQVLQRVDTNDDFNSYEQYSPTSVSMYPSFPTTPTFRQRGLGRVRRATPTRQISARNFPSTPKSVPAKRTLSYQYKRPQNLFAQQNVVHRQRFIRHQSLEDGEGDNPRQFCGDELNDLAPVEMPTQMLKQRDMVMLKGENVSSSSRMNENHVGSVTILSDTEEEVATKQMKGEDEGANNWVKIENMV